MTWLPVPSNPFPSGGQSGQTVRIRRKAPAGGVPGLSASTVVPEPPGPPRLAVPANRQVTVLSSYRLRVTASAVGSATGYRLYASSSASGPFTVLADNLPSPFFVHENLQIDTTVHYKWQTLADGTTTANSALSAAFSGTTAGFEADAQAFISAAGLLEYSQKLAVNQLVTDLKEGGVWGKMAGLYPLVGGTAAAHAVNLRQPGTYNLVFVNGPAHSAAGVAWNGTDQYARTGITPSGLGSLSLGYYSRTNAVSAGADPVDMGAYNSDQQAAFVRAAAPGGVGSMNARMFADQFGGQVPTLTGLFHADGGPAVPSTAHNGVRRGQPASVQGSLPSIEVYLGAMNLSGNAYGFATRQFAFAYVGQQLTETEATAAYTAIQKFQTALGRHV